MCAVARGPEGIGKHCLFGGSWDAGAMDGYFGL